MQCELYATYAVVISTLKVNYRKDFFSLGKFVSM